MFSAKVFQLFQPIGGVGANPSNLCAWTTVDSNVNTPTVSSLTFKPPGQNTGRS